MIYFNRSTWFLFSKWVIERYKNIPQSCCTSSSLWTFQVISFDILLPSVPCSPPFLSSFTVLWWFYLPKEGYCISISRILLHVLSSHSIFSRNVLRIYILLTYMNFLWYFHPCTQCTLTYPSTQTIFILVLLHASLIHFLVPTCYYFTTYYKTRLSSTHLLQGIRYNSFYGINNKSPYTCIYILLFFIHSPTDG